MKYQPSGAGGLQRRTALKPKMATRGPQNGRPGLERGLSLDVGRCRQLLLNKLGLKMNFHPHVEYCTASKRSSNKDILNGSLVLLVYT